MMEIVKPIVSESAIRIASEILDSCKSGEYVEVMCVALANNGKYHTIGSTSKHRAAMMGILFEMMLDLAEVRFKNDP
jgi:hypothetical protein